MAAEKIYIVRGEVDAKALRELLDNLRDAIPHMKNMSVGFFSLADPSGNTRLLKLLAADKESSDSGGQGGGGGGGGGLPEGATFREFTYCDSGSPVTKWSPTWDTDPTA